VKQVRASKVPAIAPWLEFCGDFVGGLGDLCTYRGENAPPLENKELDEFVPEVGAVFQQLQISI